MELLTTNREGERLSFYKLFSEKKYKLVVPIIQREYAQGRISDNVNEVRCEFLDALYDYLDANIPDRDLDFVYGNIQEREGEKLFVPLDGQQRLTTLFLLHWYLYCISTNLEAKTKFLDNMTHDGRSMFSYETRMSATNFCDALMANAIDMDNLYKNEEDGVPTVSATIKNKNWYYRTWNYDPTIQSMLVMLDSIHERFNFRPEFFDRLIDTEKPIITFLFMDLQKYQLTDDLYIKMNSRGKQLTPFENFKAKYEQYLKSVGQNEKFTLSIGKTTIDVDLSKYFSYNIDTKWTNLFWNYRELRHYDNDYDHFDDLVTNFIRVLFTNAYAGKIYVNQKEKNEALEELIQDDNKHLTFNAYQKGEVLSEESSLYLVKALDVLSVNEEGIPRLIPDSYLFYYDEEKMFRNAIENKLSLAERIQLHAYLQYLIRYTDTSGLADWMRVIKNLSDMDNTITDTSYRYASGIKSVNKLLDHADHILEYLADNNSIDYFSSWQVAEERVKAKLILRNDGWREEIEEVEKHDYFDGQIGFILDYSGVFDIACYDWEPDLNDELLLKFRIYKEKASKVFANSYYDRINNKNYCLERAALTKGDYYLWTSGDAFNLLTTNVVKNNVKRDYSWRRCLRVDEKDNHPGYYIFKKILDDNRFNVNDVQGSLELIAKDGREKSRWRDLLIKNPELIRYSAQGFIGNYEYSGIMLLTSLKSNATHSELHTYYLYNKYIKECMDVYPFEVRYVETTAKELLPYIEFSNYSFNRKMYEFRIYGISDETKDYEFDSYQFHFLKSKGRNQLDEYSDEIIRILESLGMEWWKEYDDGTPFSQDELGFYYEAHDEKEAVDLIAKLCKFIRVLLK